MHIRIKILLAILFLAFLCLTVFLRRPGTEKAPEAERLDPTARSTEHARNEQTGNFPTAASLALSKAEQADLDELQDLLDDGDRQQESLEKALSMTRASSQDQQLAAVHALRWLGGREAIKALIQLRKNSLPLVAEQAGDALAHLLAESMYSGGLRPAGAASTVSGGKQGNEIQPADKEASEDLFDVDDLEDEPSFSDIFADQKFDAKLWEEAISEAPTPEDRDELLILLSTFPSSDTVPVLLNMLESGNEELHAAALEYLEFVTFGAKISNRQEAEDWLATNGALEDFQE
jgi:HEAT repeat protein